MSADTAFVRLFRGINWVKVARIDVGREPVDAARVEEVTGERRSPVAGRFLAKVSRQRVSPDRPKRVRHCCRSAATMAGRTGKGELGGLPRWGVK